MRSGAIVDIGSTADWVAAIGTWLAVGAAIYAGLYAKAAHDLERSREERSAASRRRNQASRIATWPSYRIADGTYGVMVANTSDSLVYELTVKAHSQAHGDTAINLRFLPPGIYFAANPWGKDACFPDRIANEAEYRPVMSTDKYQVSATFTDAKGERWNRPYREPLQEVST